MSVFLSDIFSQPAVLADVLNHFQGNGFAVLKKAAEEISKYPRVVLTSMGSAYHSLVPMYYSLRKEKQCVHLWETSEALGLPLFPDTLYVIMSRSGESREIAKYAKMLHEKNENLLAITMSPDSVLAENASLLIHDPAPYDGLICVKAYTSMVLIGLMISSLVRGTLDQGLMKNLSDAFNWMEENKTEMEEKVSSIPWLGKSFTYLSSGVGLGLGMAGALWMEEGARIQCSCLSVDQFRHGPVERVDERFHGVFINLDNNKQDKEYIEYLQGLGGKIENICVGGESSERLAIPEFGLPIEYRILPASIPAQIIADKSAARHGREAGRMRYVDWVIK